MLKRDIPYFAIYGEPSTPLLADFLHVERVRDRIDLHGGRVEAHRHASLHQFCLWLGTAASYQLDSRTVELTPPFLTSVPPGVPHGFVLGETTDAIVVSTSNTFLTRATTGLPQLPIASALRVPQALSLGASSSGRLGVDFEALEEAYDRSGWSQAFVMEARLRLLVLHVAELVAETPPSLEGSKRADLFSRFLDLVDDRFKEHWTVERYAGALGASRYQLNAATTGALKRTPIAVIQLRGLHEARRLLLYTAMSIAEVAYALGYKDPAHFGRSFRALTGKSPAAWRKDHG